MTAAQNRTEPPVNCWLSFEITHNWWCIRWLLCFILLSVWNIKLSPSPSGHVTKQFCKTVFVNNHYLCCFFPIVFPYCTAHIKKCVHNYSMIITKWERIVRFLFFIWVQQDVCIHINTYATYITGTAPAVLGLFQWPIFLMLIWSINM